jgi:hypothetical protein
MKNRTWRVALVAVLALAVGNTGFIQSAQAGVVDTAVLIPSARDAHLAAIQTQLAREDVRAQLSRYGVEPTAIEGRLASLSDSELASLSARMEDVPAGGDGLLVVIGLTFVVLIILEMVGVIDIFKRA